MKKIYWIILMLIMASCQCLPKHNTITPLVIPVERAVLLTAESEEFQDGVFFPWAEYGKLEINKTRMQEEIDLLRVELEKFK